MQKTNLITAAGMKRLEQEFDQLWRVERPKVVQGVAEAAAEGDRSENAEYIYGKKRLREVDRQLKHLGSRLKLLKVATLPTNPRQVSFGCWVSYEDEEGNERCYQLVGPDEFAVSEGKISIDSPVGQALLHKKVDDEVLIRKPSGTITATIVAISSTKPE